MVKVDVKVKRDKYLRTEEIHRWVRMKRVGVNVFIIFSKKIVYVYKKIIYIYRMCSHSVILHHLMDIE
jgi:hypothetical protein